MGTIPGTQLAALAVGGGWTVRRILTRPPADSPITPGPYRPPQWQKPQLVSLSINWPTQSVSHSIVSDTGQPISTGDTAQFTPATYFFDAVLRTVHDRRMRLTEHPVQVGASITDHAYRLPIQVTLEIAMSDAMDEIVKGMYSSASSKSISAYQTLVKIQDSKLPLQLKTRLATYTNMLIEGIQTPDDYRTLHGMRAMIQFREIMTGTVATQTVPVSARPQTTDNTPLGSKTPADVPQAVQTSHQDDSGNWFSNVLKNFSDAAFSSPGPAL